MKTITMFLCICCLTVAGQNLQKVLFENSIVRVIELSSNNEPIAGAGQRGSAGHN